MVIPTAILLFGKQSVQFTASNDSALLRFPRALVEHGGSTKLN